MASTNEMRPSPLATAEQEVDVWWGSFSPWTLLPGSLLYGFWTAVIVVACWLALDPGTVERQTILSLVLLFWLVIAYRWGSLIFGYNYRLTTHRLFKDKGIFWRTFQQIDLPRVSRVLVKRKFLQRQLGVGRVTLLLAGPRAERIALPGVVDPEGVAAKILERSVAAKALTLVQQPV